MKLCECNCFYRAIDEGIIFILKKPKHNVNILEGKSTLILEIALLYIYFFIFLF